MKLKVGAVVAGAAILIGSVAACGKSGSSGDSRGGGGSTASSGASATVASQLVLGAGPEFKGRVDGVPGLAKVYGVTFKSFKPLDAGGPLTINALKNGQAQAANIFTTDPSIKADGFVVLTDPKNLYVAQNVLPLINKKKATPGVTKVLDGISAKLTTDDLVSLNEKVIGQKEDPATVAKQWLASKGLGTSGSEASGVKLVVGSANFQENVILAQIYIAALKAQGANVTPKLNIGNRETYIPGLKDGSIDLIPEYNGVLLQFFDKKATAVTSTQVFAALKKAVPSTLMVLTQSAAQDKDAIVVTKATAQKYNLTSIADLAKPAK
ncbi:MAG: glycine betaine ABC transporter substrate-binding protein [Mycobacteriales bacterium]